MPKKTKPEPEPAIHFRLPNSELAIIQSAAQRSGLKSATEWYRAVLLAAAGSRTLLGQLRRAADAGKKFGAVALLCFAACVTAHGSDGPKVDGIDGPDCDIAPVAPYSYGDAPIEHAWCPNRIPVLVVDYSYAEFCGGTEMFVFEQWLDQGFTLGLRYAHLREGEALPYGSIYLRFERHDDSGDYPRVDIVHNGFAMFSAEIVAGECHACSLAKDVGTALGFGAAFRPGALMGSRLSENCEMSGSEIAAYEASRL